MAVNFDRPVTIPTADSLEAAMARCRAQLDRTASVMARLEETRAWFVESRPTARPTLRLIAGGKDGDDA
jgi:hypothetical protein